MGGLSRASIWAAVLSLSVVVGCEDVPLPDGGASHDASASETGSGQAPASGGQERDGGKPAKADAGRSNPGPRNDAGRDATPDSAGLDSGAHTSADASADAEADSTVDAGADAAMEAEASQPPAPTALVFETLSQFEFIDARETGSAPDAGGLRWFVDAAAYTAHYGRTLPGTPDLTGRVLLAVESARGPFPGQAMAVDALWQSETEVWAETSVTRAGNDCHTFAIHSRAVAVLAVTRVAVPSLDTRLEQTDGSIACATAGASASAQCDPRGLCAPQYFCAGISRGYGLCNPETMHGRYSSETIEAIPDAGTLVRELTADGLATVDMDVLIRLELNHPDPSELYITLENPSSNVVLVFDGEGLPGGDVVLHRIPVGFSGDESVNGAWTLRVEDTQAGNVGQLRAVELEIGSRLD